MNDPIKKVKNKLRPLYHILLDGYFTMLSMMRKGSLPDFIIIGTQKGGTTSLYHYLSQHPKVISAAKKEVHFFDFNYKKGIDWYKAHFLLAKKKKKVIPLL